jgi:EmrB/QacA subfamily drug resistance transporter
MFLIVAFCIEVHTMASLVVSRLTDSVSTRWVVLAIVLLADIIDLLDASITNIAAPSIAASLGGGPALVQWLGASYLLSMGALLVPGGRLGDKFGRRRLFLTGIAGFTLASIACGLSLSPVQIIVARLIQGAFGALLIPQGFGMLGAVFPREDLGKAFSAFGPVMGLSAVGGPILAGALIHANVLGLGWRAAFLINIVIGGVALLSALMFLPSDRGDRAVHIDLRGAALLGASVLAVLFSLIEGSASGWPPLTLAIGVAGVALFAVFWRQQQVTDEPLLQPSLFRNRGFTSGLAVGIAFFAALSGLMLVISLFAQYGLAYSPLDAALTTAPVAIGISVAAVIASRFITEHGRAVVYAGLLLTIAGALALAVTLSAPGAATGPWRLALPLLIVGLGAGAAFGAVFTVALGDIAASEAGSASGSLSAVQQLAAAAGAAAVTTVYFQRIPVAGQTGATATSLLVVVATLMATLVLVRRMPLHGQADGH